MLQPEPFVEAILNQHGLTAGHVLVDVGCGRGDYRHSTGADYIGVDRDNQYGVEPDIVGEADRLPFEKCMVDAVMCKSAFFQFPDPMRALAEYFRVLTPGGRLFLFDYNRRTQKRLELTEHAARPKWTAPGLAFLVWRAGYTDIRLLLPRERQPSGVRKIAALASEELRGQWAVVTAVKPVRP